MTFKELKDRFFAASLEECRIMLSEYSEHNFFDKASELLDKEEQRLLDMCKYETFLQKSGISLIAGTDEAGRGPLAGPIVAAAVILKNNDLLFGINDSKKLSAEKRDRLFDAILDNCVAASIHIITNKQIDEINIGKADRLALKTSVEKLTVIPDHVLTDAFVIEDLNINQTPVTHGDALSVSIAAASIIAKVSRDRMMNEYDRIYPRYGFAKHKGYGTKEHINAIKKYGICPIHRKTFVKKYTDI